MELEKNNMIELKKIFGNLSLSRPVFHSEADFQHALAWEIHKRVQNCEIRLEYKPPYIMKRFYVDIWCSQEDVITAIELKYKTEKLYVKVKEETFDLLKHSAQNIGRYEFLEDIQRLEEIVLSRRGIEGYAIFLTNASYYWSYPKNSHTIDADFRIHQSRVLAGELKWRDGKRETIHIKNIYDLNWQDYSEPSLESHGKFRYLLLKVES